MSPEEMHATAKAFKADVDQLADELVRVLTKHVDNHDPDAGYHPNVAALVALVRVRGIVETSSDPVEMVRSTDAVRDCIFVHAIDPDGDKDA